MNKVNVNQSEYLVEKYQLLVYKIARRFKNPNLEFEDLVQAGLMGLFKATLKYDVTKNTKFITFATHYIIGAIKDEMRKKWTTISVINYELHENLNEIEGKYLNMLAYDFTDLEQKVLELRLRRLSQLSIATELDLSQSTVSRILKNIKVKLRN